MFEIWSAFLDRKSGFFMVVENAGAIMGAFDEQWGHSRLPHRSMSMAPRGGNALASAPTAISKVNPPFVVASANTWCSEAGVRTER